MTNDKSKVLRIIAASCFTVAAIYYWYTSLLVSELFFLFVFEAITFTVFAISLFANKKTLMLIASIIGIVSEFFYMLIEMLFSSFQLDALIKILLAVAILVLVTAYKNANKSLISKFWFVPIILEIIEKLVYSIEQSFDFGFITIFIIASWVLLCVYIKKAGSAITLVSAETVINNEKTVEITPKQTNVNSGNISQLNQMKMEDKREKYKKLLESGIITQEEYEKMVK